MSVVCTILFRRVCRPPSSRHSRPCIAPCARTSAEKAPGVVGSCTCVHQRHVWGGGGSPRRPGGSKRRLGPLARRSWVPPLHRGGPRQPRPQSTRRVAAARGRRSAARPFSPTCSPLVSELQSERASERENALGSLVPGGHPSMPVDLHDAAVPCAADQRLQQSGLVQSALSVDRWADHRRRRHIPSEARPKFSF